MLQQSVSDPYLQLPFSEQQLCVNNVTVSKILLFLVYIMLEKF